MMRPLVVCTLLLHAAAAAGQTVTQRGFVETSGLVYPQNAPNDTTRAVGDLLVRDEVFVTASSWLQVAAGVDLRANCHNQVDDRWRIDWSDRTTRRPRIAIRRLSATLHRGAFTVDLGKQFIRWGRTDIVTPTDRFAPRDFLNVVDTEFLPVTGARAVAQFAKDAVEVVWVPQFTPSRVPLLTQRWTAVPAAAAAIPLVDAGAELPSGPQTGVRWNHTGDIVEYSVSFFDGFNYLPNIASVVERSPLEIRVVRTYPGIRTYGADVAIPTRWMTMKGEAAYFTSPSPDADEYVLYVVQLERQTGEWTIAGGYAGEAVTAQRAAFAFAPDRGLSRAIVGRASYTIDPNRSIAVEAAVRQSGSGVYGKLEYSQAHGDHWRTTATAVAIGGHSDDFLGQYHRNSHAMLALRYSF